MAVQSDGKIVIAGSFRSVNDVARPGLARLNSDGSLDLTWKPLITILSQQPLSSVVVAGTNIYICGGVFLVNNNQTDQRAITRLSILDGTTDQTWNPGFNGGVISTMAVSAGNVYVGGTFTSVGILPRNGLARLDLEGTVDLDWNPAPNGSVQKLALTGTSVFVAGNFSTIGGQARPGLAKLSAASGQADPVWNRIHREARSTGGQ